MSEWLSDIATCKPDLCRDCIAAELALFKMVTCVILIGFNCHKVLGILLKELSSSFLLSGEKISWKAILLKSQWYGYRQKPEQASILPWKWLLFGHVLSHWVSVTLLTPRVWPGKWKVFHKALQNVRFRISILFIAKLKLLGAENTGKIGKETLQIYQSQFFSCVEISFSSIRLGNARKKWV